MSSIWTSTLIYTFYNFGFGYFSDSSKIKFIKIYIFYRILHKNLTFYKFFKNVQKIFQKFLTFFNYLIVSLLVFSQNGFPQTPQNMKFQGQNLCPPSAKKVSSIFQHFEIIYQWRLATMDIHFNPFSRPSFWTSSIL